MEARIEHLAECNAFSIDIPVQLASTVEVMTLITQLEVALESAGELPCSEEAACSWKNCEHGIPLSGSCSRCLG